MQLTFDLKLLQHIRFNIERLKDENLHLFGIRNSDHIVIVAGWFESDALKKPLSDKICKSGFLTYGFDPEIASIGWTDSDLIISKNPLKFQDVTGIEYRDTREIICESLMSVFVSFNANLPSAHFVVGCGSVSETSQSKVIDIREDDEKGKDPLSAFCDGENRVFLSQLVLTGNDCTDPVPDPVSTIAGIFTKALPLKDILKRILSEQEGLVGFKTLVNWKYLHIPVMVHDSSSAENEPRSIKTSRLLNAHSLMRQHPQDAVICQNGYEYFHYNIDGVHDAGWGCAYRSLQMLMSWFHNNYSCFHHIFSIIEIQEILRTVDHAHADLQLGSKRWIGCFEASTFLSEESDGKIECKILHVSEPSELTTHLFGTVTEHLVEIGSPVMVGAGDFAYTIIGVSCESRQVLVLDPHFSGSNSKIALSNGYIAWIRIETLFKWNKLSSGFINICLPIHR